MKSSWWIAGMLMSAVAAGAIVHAQSELAAKSNLAGAWTLNRDLSDQPGGGYGAGSGNGSGSQGRHGGMGGGGGHMGRGGMGGGGMGNGGERSQASAEQMAARRDMVRELMTAPTSLTITQSDELVSFTEPDGHTVKYRTDGTKEAHQLTSGTVETKTRWDEGQLIVETELGDGFKVVHTYSVSPQDRQLIVQIKTEVSHFSRGDRPPIKHVYDQTSS
jgi:hypothetical protein